MPSFSQALLIGYLIGAIQVWWLVLKKSAYPESIPRYLKWIHAFILFFVMSSAFYSFFAVFLWFVFHPSEILACLTLQPNPIGDPLLGISGLIRGLGGTLLLPVCVRMAKRQKNALKWYFVLWPIVSISSCYMEIRRHGEIQLLPAIPIITTVFFMVFVLIVTVGFYSAYCTKIFEEREAIDLPKS